MLLAFAVVSLGSIANAAIERPFQAGLSGAFTFGACPASAPARATCLHDHVSGQISYLGQSTGEFDVVIDTAAAGADGCAPITKRGFFTASNRDRLNVSAQGRYCFATLAATYTYSIIGGSGRFIAASGAGTWLVPKPATISGTGGAGDEHLRGTLVYGKLAGREPGLAVPHSPARVAQGEASVLLSCPSSSSGCSGTLTLSLGRQASVRPPQHRTYTRAVSVGRARFTLVAGARRIVRVSLSARARRSLAHAHDHRLRVTATIAHRQIAITLVEPERP